MADIVKTTKQLNLVAGFEDGDDRTITVDNPKDDITAAKLNGTLKNNATMTLIGDKAGAKFTGWNSALIVETTVTTLDLENP